MNEIILQGIEFISSAAYGGLVWDSIKQLFGVENGKRLELAREDSAEELKSQLESQLKYDEPLQQKLQTWLEQCDEFQQWKATGQGSKNVNIGRDNYGSINQKGGYNIGKVENFHANGPSGEKTPKKF